MGTAIIDLLHSHGQLPYLAPMLVSAALCVLLGLTAVRRRRVPGATAFSAVMLTIAWWTVTYALQLVANDLSAKMWWYRLQFLGITALPVAWLAFALGYSGKHRILPWRVLGLICAVPAATNLLLWTNSLHHLMYGRLWLHQEGPFQFLETSHRAWFWLHAGYSYVLLIAGTALLARTALRSPQRYRAQLLALLAGSLAPWVANAVYLLKVLPPPRFDLTPFAFAITGIASAWGFLRMGLLDVFVGLIPEARDAIVEGMRDGVFVLDERGDVVDVNPAAAHIMARPASRLVGRAASDLFPTMTLCEGDPVAFSFDGTVPGSQGEIVLGKGRKQRYYDVQISPLRRGHGHVAGHLVVLRDITDRRKSEAAMAALAQRYQDLIENASEAIYTMDVKGRLTSVNRAAERIVGYSRDECLRLSIETLVVPEHRQMARRLLRQRSQTDDDGVEGGTYEMDILAKGGRRVSLEVSSRTIYEDGIPVGAEGIARDVTERKQWAETLQHRALHDPLTDLPNRLFLHRRLEEAIDEAAHHGSQVTLLVMDLDHFKEVNDTFGHHYGDVLLQQIGPRLQRRLRRTDVVARLGGDEFAVLLPTTDATSAVPLSQTLLRTFDDPFVVEGEALKVGTSIGVAVYPIDGVDTETLLRHADVAMYAAKRSRSGVASYGAQPAAAHAG